MCTASRPRLPAESAPPPMIVPESVSESVQKKRSVERRRLASAEGQQSTVMAPMGAAPTAQQKTLLGA